MREIEITTPKVHKMLQNLKTHKAPGQDSISPRVLRELADIIVPMLTMVYRKSYNTAKYQQSSGRLMLCLFPRKETKVKPTITDLYH